MSKLLDDVVGELTRLPGIGRRTAFRLAMYMLRMERDEVRRMTAAMDDFRQNIMYCKFCNNLSDTDVCPICLDERRDRTTVCVVEQVGDVVSIENTRQYKGLYHVLGGVISPMQGIGPSDLKIDLLLENIGRGEIREVILAVSATVEGETTQFYIMRRLEGLLEGVAGEINITCIARGIGFGDELEYADELTIAHAIHNRTKMK
ncbi:MAG: recombination mediator RecR [Rikenellaceae bacterium]|nr:recombination mediator RecR [Rikenellaceae bacterium]MCL2693023.1 recombination mediator RecR [Rikenellaceae bacterium]